jgi:endonuclease/exonuclease/phosphatase family metal-dependent hydrolase
LGPWNGCPGFKAGGSIVVESVDLDRVAFDGVVRDRIALDGIIRGQGYSRRLRESRRHTACNPPGLRNPPSDSVRERTFSSKDRSVRKLLILALLVSGVGGYFYVQRYGVSGLQAWLPKPGGDASAATSGIDAPPVKRNRNTIRIASFNVQRLDESKLSQSRVRQALIDVIRRFDIVAIQDLHTPGSAVLPDLLEAVNVNGSHYGYVLGPPDSLMRSLDHFAFVYDTASIEVDPDAVYRVEDPADLIEHDPLVAAFRVRGPAAEDAFTFTLVTMHISEDRADAELDMLPEIFRAVRNDGRGEDDVILLGDFRMDAQGLFERTEGSGLMPITLNLSGRQGEPDNMLLHHLATVEFTGRAGQFDLMREFQLLAHEAREISGHIPLWAEFSLVEGGQPNRVVRLPDK